MIGVGSEIRVNLHRILQTGISEERQNSSQRVCEARRDVFGASW